MFHDLTFADNLRKLSHLIVIPVLLRSALFSMTPGTLNIRSSSVSRPLTYTTPISSENTTISLHATKSCIALSWRMHGLTTSSEAAPTSAAEKPFVVQPPTRYRCLSSCRVVVKQLDSSAWPSFDFSPIGNNWPSHSVRPLLNLLNLALL